jgi:hypothetical protein
MDFDVRVALMSYHKNVNNIYPSTWVQEYRGSIENQTHDDFVIFEVAYGESQDRIFGESIYLHKEFPSFNHVQNFLLSELFRLGFDCVFNSNVDDKYSLQWIEKMLPWVEKGYDIVSCNFVLFDDGGMIKKHQFENLNIEDELGKNHNPVCHPAVCYNKTFWDKGNRYDPEDVKTKDEDMRLWKRAIRNSKFIILPEHLCYHSLHSNSVCQSTNK